MDFFKIHIKDYIQVLLNEQKSNKFYREKQEKFKKINYKENKKQDHEFSNEIKDLEKLKFLENSDLLNQQELDNKLNQKKYYIYLKNLELQNYFLNKLIKSGIFIFSKNHAKI